MMLPPPCFAVIYAGLYFFIPWEMLSSSYTTLQSRRCCHMEQHLIRFLHCSSVNVAVCLNVTVVTRSLHLLMINTLSLSILFNNKILNILCKHLPKPAYHNLRFNQKHVFANSFFFLPTPQIYICFSLECCWMLYQINFFI